MDRDKFRDQAFELRSRMNEINNNSEPKPEYKYDEEDDFDNVNILDLPPRSQVHEIKKSKMKWRISFPLVRLLVVLFILIVLLVLTYQIWGKELMHSPIMDNQFNKHPAGEMVKILP